MPTFFLLFRCIANPCFLLALSGFAFFGSALAVAETNSLNTANAVVKRQMPQDYVIVPGDVLDISVWREEGMSSKVLVLPNGSISFPLVGNLMVGGMTPDQLRDELKSRLGPFLSAPEVTVSVLSSNQKVYVVGKVNKPGEFPIPNRISVMQVLSMAGGLTPYADRDDISILRRTGKDDIRFNFNYEEMESGENLGQNILLQNGDVVIVP